MTHEYERKSFLAAYPGLVLLLLLVQLGLIYTGSVQVKPQGLSYPRQERGEQRGHVCQTESITNCVSDSMKPHVQFL